jgi:hypothetical protein
MIVKIADGTQVELTPMVSKVMLTQDVFGLGLGPFLVVGQDGDLPVIQLVEGKDAPVSPELIASVDNPEESKVEVRLPSGDIVLVDAKVAPILQAIVDTNVQLLDQLGKLLSGEEFERLKKDIEIANMERDAALAQVETVRGSLPVLEEAVSMLQKTIEVLKNG